MGTHVRERESYVPELAMVERRQLREHAERTIEALIAMLDELDGDPDLEEDDPAEDNHDLEELYYGQ